MGKSILSKRLKQSLIVILLNLIIFHFGHKVNSETEFEFYLNDFSLRRSKAIKILKEVEFDLKNGSRKNSCFKQREAAKIGLKANESLLKAYKIIGSIPPIEVIESNNKKWNNILENCYAEENF
tara:strand:- start:48 stop:419 length:372 start_codon:yes stop_codon:yes gene_type:complete